MSKTVLLNGGAVDFTAIRSVLKSDVTSLLQQIVGTKCVVLDMSLSHSINSVLEGASIFKENNVVTISKLTGEPIQTNADAVVFICKESTKTLKMMADLVKTLHKERKEMTYHLFIIPHRTQHCEQFLRDQDIFSFITIHDFEMDLIPLDNDLISMELENVFTDLYLKNNYAPLKYVAEALLKLQTFYGPFHILDAIGERAQYTLDLMKELQPSGSFFEKIPSTVNQVVLIDRAIDFTSLFVTPLTYEALINEIIGIDAGTITMNGREIGKRDDAPVSIALNSNDSLFGEISSYNISVVPRFLKEKSREIQELYNSRPKDSRCDIMELSNFVKKVQTIQEVSESMEAQLAIANKLTQVTGSDAFGQKWQKERELLEGDNIIENIKDNIDIDMPIESILHYLIIYSLVNSGLKPKDYEAVYHEILLTYGFDKLPLLESLAHCGLLVSRSGSSNYSTLRNRLRLIRDDIDGTQPIDLNYVTSGYAPISSRVIQALLLNSSPMTDVAKVVGTTYNHREQEVKHSGEVKNTVFVVFIGGITFLETAALHIFEKLHPEIEIVVLTTNMYKGEDVINEVMQYVKLPEN